MVFSSIPAYLDPSNWQQQQNHHQIIGSSSGNPLLPPPPSSGPHAPPHGGVGAGSVRPGLMAERARMANIPLPEPALKCPRCDSTNTKFCYFNNYSLSQPRHFCKTCRRYWTRGGALRSVPVGGGCRRNKRSKSSSRSKSPAASADRETATGAVTATTAVGTMTYNSSSSCYNNMLGLPPPLRFMSPLAQFAESFSGDQQHMGLSGYSGITTPAGAAEMNFHGNFSQIMSSDGGEGNIIEPWRLQQHQFPFVGSMEQPPSPAGTLHNYQFHGESSFVAAAAGQSQRPKFSSSPVKTEERPPLELNLSRQLLGGLMSSGNEPWSSNNNDNNNNNNNDNNNSMIAPNWNELASFSSSSTSNPL